MPVITLPVCAAGLRLSSSKDKAMDFDWRFNPPSKIYSSDETLSGRRVLVIEDEYFIADDVAQALRRLGAEIVGPYPTLVEALFTLDRPEPIDAAVVDLDLRGELGFQAADALLARGVPFILATGYDRTAIPAAYGNVPLWQKPFDAAALARALLKMLKMTSPSPYPSRPATCSSSDTRRLQTIVS